MATTCKLIAKSVLGADAADVTFSDIPGTYTDLYLVASARTLRPTVVENWLRLTFNGVTTNQSSRYMYGNGSSQTSGTETMCIGGLATAAAVTADTFGNSELYIPNYAGSTNKSSSMTGVSENNDTDARIYAFANLWSSTDAITSIKLSSTTGQNLKSGSSFYLYGILKA